MEIIANNQAKMAAANYRFIFTLLLIILSFSLLKGQSKVPENETSKYYVKKKEQLPYSIRFNENWISFSMKIYLRDIKWKNTNSDSLEFSGYKKKVPYHWARISILDDKAEEVSIVYPDNSGQLRMKLKTGNLAKILISSEKAYPIEIPLSELLHTHSDIHVILYENMKGNYKKKLVRKTIFRH